MPIHDWTRVDAGIFHHFHQRWISAIADVLNQRLLPGDYYALAEQQGARFEPDILTLEGRATAGSEEPPQPPDHDHGKEARGRGVLVAEPHVRITAESALDFYRRKQNVVAVVEVVSKGHTSGRKALDDFVRKAAEFLGHDVHLLILDLQPTTLRDPQGIHGAIWDEVAGQEYVRPADKPLTLAAYESGPCLRAFIEPVGVGDPLIDMPLFLDPGRYVAVPLEETYRTAFDSVPGRWRTALEAG
jgi:hypothetical protein